MYRPNPVPRLRVEKNGSNRYGSTSGGIGGPSLAMLRKAWSSRRESSRRWIAPGAWLAWRRALSSRLTSTRRRCSASNSTPTGSAGSETRNRPPSLWTTLLRTLLPMLLPIPTPAERAHSLHTAAICAVASMTPTSSTTPGATSITSSTMRLRRSTLSLTICIRRRWAGSVLSSNNSALACEMADKGLRISCAMPAETRPIAASFSWRLRACILRTSSRNSTQNSSIDSGSRLRVKRTRTRRVRCAARPLAPAASNCSTTSRPAAGHAASPKARSTVVTSACQAAMPRNWNGAGRLMPCGASKRRAAGFAARTRPRRSTTSTPSCISSITSRFN